MGGKEAIFFHQDLTQVPKQSNRAFVLLETGLKWEKKEIHTVQVYGKYIFGKISINNTWNKWKWMKLLLFSAIASEIICFGWEDDQMTPLKPILNLLFSSFWNNYVKNISLL